MENQQEKRKPSKNRKESPHSRKQTIRMWALIVLASAPIIVVVVQNGIYLSRASDEIRRADEVRRSLSFINSMGQLVHGLSQEQAIGAFYASSVPDDDTREILVQSYQATDEAFVASPYGKHWPGGPGQYSSPNSMHEVVVARRRHLDATRNSGEYREPEVYADMTQTILEWIGDKIVKAEHDAAWQKLVALHLLLWTEREVGNECALGITYYAKGQLPRHAWLQFRSSRAKHHQLLHQASLLSARADRFYNHHQGSLLRTSIERYGGIVAANAALAPDLVTAQHFLQLFSAYMTSLHQLEEPLTLDLNASHLEVDQARNTREYSSLLLIIAVLLLWSIIIIMTRQLLEMTGLFRLGQRLVRVASSLFDLSTLGGTEEKAFSTEPNQDVRGGGARVNAGFEDSRMRF